MFGGNWYITQLTVDPTYPDYPNTILVVTYTLKITTTIPETGGVSSMHYSILVKLAPPGPNFIPYLQLTEQEVTNWVISIIGPDLVGYENDALQQTVNAANNLTLAQIPDTPHAPFPWEL